MSTLIARFRDCAHQTGDTCGQSIGTLIRKFGLRDFLENRLTASDSVEDIAIKALEFFCEGSSPHEPQFKFAVLTVGIFLNENLANPPIENEALAQPLRDLVAILAHGFNEQSLRRWIQSHFQA
jgi:hypothetical protein